MWVVLSLLAAITAGGMLLISQYFRLPGFYIFLWMRIFILALLTPVMLQVEWPKDPFFYLIVSSTGIIAVVGDIRTFNVAARYGGGVVARLQPLTVWIAFFLWPLVHPEIIGHYGETPWRSLGIVASLLGCGYFASRLRHCTVSRAAFRESLPAIVAYGLATIFNKLAMDHSPLHGGVYGYMYVQSLVVLPILAIYVKLYGKAITSPHRLCGRTAIIAGLAMSSAWLMHMVAKNYAMKVTIDPSYVAAIGLTAPLWIALFYRATGHRETADVASGFGVVVCVLALVLLTA